MNLLQIMANELLRHHQKNSTRTANTSVFVINVTGIMNNSINSYKNNFMGIKFLIIK